MTQPVVQVQGLTKLIKHQPIIDQINFSMGAGEIVGLLGPNGAGKTTLIRLLVGLVHPDNGQITICGHDLKTQFTAAIANVGTIIETPAFYNYLSGLENLRQAARLSRQHISDAQLIQTAASVGLAKKIKQPVRTYSLGMRQRLGVGQAILHHPDVLLLDEPMNGLDPLGMHDLRHILRRLADNGTSILISSHILSDIERLADQLLVIQDGEMTFQGRLDHLIPQNQHILLETDNQPQTLIVLRKMGLKFEIRADQLLIATPADQQNLRQNLVAELVAQGVGVRTIKTEKPTLEERFLDVTQRRNV